MHHHIIVKVWAGDAEEAESIVSDEMENSTRPENNTIGWDYFGGATRIEEKDLPNNYQVKSFKELEKKYIEDREIEINDAKAKIKEDLMIFLAPFFLTKTEAILYVNTENDEFKKCVERILKRKTDIKTPDSFEKVLNIRYLKP